MIVCASFHLPNYTELANLTDANKIEYAKIHNYRTHFEVVEKCEGHVCFEKYRVILRAFERYPMASWVWYSDCDSMVTNMGCLLEKLTIPFSTIIATSDVHGLNTGSILWENSALAKGVLGKILQSESKFKDNPMADQAAVPLPFVSFLFQRAMNSYDYALYGNENNEGQWQPGDFVIHFPGLSLEKRIELVRKYSKGVVF